MSELPPLPEPARSALVFGFGGSEYRSLSDTWEPHSARYSHETLIAYARAAVEAEREACAKVCDSLVLRPNLGGDEDDRIWAAGVSDGAHQLAAEIRARAKA